MEEQKQFRQLAMAEPEGEPAKRRCPACESADPLAKGERNGFQMLCCKSCGTLYTSCLPNSSDAQDYDSYYNAENLSAPDFVLNRLDEIVASFSAYKRTNRLLDIGFGSGVLMQSAARAGWEAEGVEVSRTAVNHIKELGFKAFCGELADARYPDDYFDVITASELLEHLPDPGKLMREVARILRPGGLFWGTTPHFGGASGKLLGLKWTTVAPPEHLQLFSRSGMKTLLGRAGFGRLNIASHGVNPYEIIFMLRQRINKDEKKTDDAASSSPSQFDRVSSSYSLNSMITSSPSRRALKTALNGILNMSRLGDSLKIRAEK